MKIKKFNEVNSDEIGMASIHLKKMIENAENILNNIESLGDDLPAWVQDKLSVSNHNLEAINDWMNREEIIEESVDDKKSKAYKSLKNKSEDSGISITTLKQVYKRGMAAWNSGHRPGTPQNAWAMGRVNSFITGSGGARKADSDLWSKAKKNKKK